jgi:hypothetical protein
MGGLLIILSVGGYVWITSKLLLRARGVLLRATIVIAALLIPTTDAVYGRIKLQELCDSSGGVRAIRTAEDVEGLFSNLLGESLIRRIGYTYVETPDLKAGAYIRYVRQATGQIEKEKALDLRSKYELRFTPGNPKDNYMIDTLRVVSRDTDEVLGAALLYSYSGGWVERLIASVFASRATAGTCDLNDPILTAEFLVSATLKPRK